MKQEKIIFLDIDGVLVTSKSMKHYGHHEAFDTQCANNLAVVIERTQAKVVVSSTWRRLYTIQELMDKLSQNGIAQKHVIGVTPCLDGKVNGLYVSKTRGQEIEAWMQLNSVEQRGEYGVSITSFVVLDDDKDISPFENRHVHTNFNTGLTVHHAKRAIELLNTPL